MTSKAPEAKVTTLMQTSHRLNAGSPAILRRQNGVMLLALIIFMTILGLAVTKTADVWSTALAREREQELLFIGEQYRMAIEKYYYATPGPRRALPATLDELVQDDRFPKPLRHLRQLYPDPIQGVENWGILRQGSRIVGVYSLSDQKPIKKAGFGARYTDFSAAQSYRGWRFIFRAPGTQLPGGQPIEPNSATSGPK